MSYITCRNASFAYEGNVVIGNLNFSINPGDYLCIVGENGSGKSTLIKGLLKLKQPYTGTLTLGDGLKPNEIGYLPQQTEAQKDFPASAYEVVLSGRLSMRGFYPFYSKQDKKTALENISLLGIDPFKHGCYRELSGGQQQRVLLARALCSTKKLLLLDEPVAGLDPIVTQEFYQLLESINKKSDITIVMVSHDIHSAVKYADKILHLKSEQIFFGTTSDYINSPAGASFLGGEKNA